MVDMACPDLSEGLLLMTSPRTSKKKRPRTISKLSPRPKAAP